MTSLVHNNRPATLVFLDLENLYRNLLDRMNTSNEWYSSFTESFTLGTLNSARRLIGSRSVWPTVISDFISVVTVHRLCSYIVNLESSS